MNLKFHEWLLICMAVHFMLWVVGHSIGASISIGLSLLSLIIVIIASISEKIEVSKVPKWYFWLMWAFSITGLLSLLIFRIIIPL